MVRLKNLTPQDGLLKYEKNLREWGEEEMDAEGGEGGAEGIRESVEENEHEDSSSVPHEEAKVGEKRLYSHSFIDRAGTTQTDSLPGLLLDLSYIHLRHVDGTSSSVGISYKAESYTNKLDVRAVNQDDGENGTFIAEGLLSRTDLGYYSTPSSHFPSNSDITHDIVEEGSWGAIVINEGVTGALLQARQNSDASYNGSRVINAYYAQARQENAANEFLVPLLRACLEKLCENFNLHAILPAELCHPECLDHTHALSAPAMDLQVRASHAILPSRAYSQDYNLQHQERHWPQRSVLIDWILVNFVTITVGSYYYRRKAVSAHKQKVAEEKGKKGA
ncbi:hypothetical protein L198_06376 [Cryptococcus wingfieldii CBS 7118]|uniref:DUF3533 domain-containing protein n=1 Tax=Cryptococcus wingfieldii CBS 7118 TaxID=1295528 RepID=A0A1E3IP32_9TREE|nr:hypothetical protein L198_06376 [Cryptococcus wingfieldii CBS 7118]ODN89686.1 hypothetical protein L198_06376 [Cryptococcus wingfieldii CBS 7118]